MTSSEQITKRFGFIYRNVAADAASAAISDEKTESVEFRLNPWAKDGEEERYQVTINYKKEVRDNGSTNTK